MKKSKPSKLSGNLAGVPFNFDVNKDIDTDHTMIFEPACFSQGKERGAAYAALGLSDAEFALIKNGGKL